MAIVRYLKQEEHLKRMQTDLGFLLKRVPDPKSELDLALRDGYFNLYFQGNSLAKVSFRPDNQYEVAIHSGFFRGTKAEKDDRFKDRIKTIVTKPTKGKPSKELYCLITVDALHIHPLLQASYLNEFAAKIRARNYGEELTFEQMIIADNLGRDELILIDRQITDEKLERRRMDLLALKRVEARKYTFLVIEVKLGKNPELSSDVGEQLMTYVDHINESFADYKACYEEAYRQKKLLGLIGLPFDTIEIVPNAEGMIVVGGYSGQAKEQLQKLRDLYPDLVVKPFSYKLELD